MRVWVVDTSPLIFLAKLDRLDLLRREAERVVVPPLVLQNCGGVPMRLSKKLKRLWRRDGWRWSQFRTAD